MGNITNWGILATGKIARTFAKAVNYVPDAKLYACASRNIEKARAFAAEYGADKAYGSYEELASDPNIDIIYIASPMSCHYENAKLCLEHGKNVLCEKSITLNASQLDGLISAAKSGGLFFMEAMWMKFLPSFLKAKEWVSDGRIGDIKSIRADFSNPVVFDANDRLFRPELGGGALLDLGVYPITFVTSFLGCDTRRIMSVPTISGGIDLDEAVIMDYSGAYAYISAGFSAECENRAVIAGEKGRIVFDPWYFCTDTVRLYGADGNLAEESVTPHLCNGYEYEITEAQRCLSEGLKESPLNPLSCTMDVMKIMDSLRNDWGLEFPNEK